LGGREEAGGTVLVDGRGIDFTEAGAREELAASVPMATRHSAKGRMEYVEKRIMLGR